MLARVRGASRGGLRGARRAALSSSRSASRRRAEESQLFIERYPSPDEVPGGDLPASVYHNLEAARPRHAAADAWEYAAGPNRLLVLDRPRALNALTEPMVDWIAPRLRAWEDNPAVNSIMLAGAGGKALCAGGDVVALYHAGKAGADTSSFFRKEYTLNHLISTLATPYVAFLDGVTMGGGVGLSVHGRYRVATERTLFAMPETAIGFFTDVGGSYFLPRLAGRLGAYLALTGARLKGADAVHAGIATHYVPSATVPAVMAEMEVNRFGGWSFAGAVLDRNDASASAPEFTLTPHLDAIDRCFGADSVEGVMGALRAEGTEWAAKTLRTLEGMCPLALKVTHRLLVEGAQMSIEECLRMEFRVSQAFMADPNFFEGVRALLVDGDKKPQWSHASVDAVGEQEVEKFFAALPDPRDELLLGSLDPEAIARKESEKLFSKADPFYTRKRFGNDPSLTGTLGWERL